MENKITIQLKTTAKDFRALTFFNLFLKKKIMAIFLPIAAVFSAAAVIGKYAGLIEVSDWYFFVCLAFLGLTVLQFLLFEYSVRRFLASDQLVVDNERTVTVSESGLTEEGGKENSTGSFQWDMFYCVYETKKYFYLYINTMQAIILPKREYNQEQINAMEKLIKEKMGKNFYKR